MGTNSEILKKLEFFGTLGEDALGKLSGIAEEAFFKKGDVLISEGKPAGSLFIIKSGCVKISKQAGGLDVVLGEGNAVGELSFVDKEPPSATATAMEDTSALRIPSGAFDSLMNEDREFAFGVYKAMAESLCRKLRDTNEWLATKMWLSEIEKEAAFLPRT